MNVEDFVRNAFMAGVLIALVLILAGLLVAAMRTKKSHNDIEVERLKSNVPIYPWQDAPDWAVCAATDVDGNAWWFANAKAVKTEEGFDFWWSSRRSRFSVVTRFTLPSRINWKDSKEMRP